MKIVNNSGFLLKMSSNQTFYHPVASGPHFRFSQLLILVLVWSCISSCSCTDDYEYLERIYRRQERQVRAQSKGVPDAVQSGGLYSIESVANNLYLTAKNGFIQPGPTVLKKYSESGSQFWGVVKYDTSRGYNLKPLSNEFNEVTSTLENNAHAYNAWEFKHVAGSKNHFIIFNTISRRCLQTAMLKESVKFVKCQPGNFLQHWKIHRVE